MQRNHFHNKNPQMKKKKILLPLKKKSLIKKPQLFLADDLATRNHLQHMHDSNILFKESLLMK